MTFSGIHGEQQPTVDGRRFFEARCTVGGPLHLVDSRATVGGQTVCGKRWWKRSQDRYLGENLVEGDKDAPRCLDCYRVAAADGIRECKTPGKQEA